MDPRHTKYLSIYDKFHDAPPKETDFSSGAAVTAEIGTYKNLNRFKHMITAIAIAT